MSGMTRYQSGMAGRVRAVTVFLQLVNATSPRNAMPCILKAYIGEKQ